MATRLSTDDVVSADGAQAADGTVKHHQLTILAASLADVVGSRAVGCSTGRGPAGMSTSGSRAAAMCGRWSYSAPTRSTSQPNPSCASVPRDGAVAVSATLLRDDPRVRDRVFRLAKGGAAEVMAWGDEWPVELGGRIDAIEHRLSVAARAFKVQALAAAQLRQSVGATETLFDLAVDLAVDLAADLAAESLRPLYPV